MKQLLRWTAAGAVLALAAGCFGGEPKAPNPYNTKAALIAHRAAAAPAQANSVTPQEYSTKRALISKTVARGAACPACGTWHFAPASYNTKLALRGERVSAFEQVPAPLGAKCACAACDGCSLEGCARM